MAVKGLISDDFLKDFETLLGYSLPNGLVINSVLGWLHAASDKLERDTFIKIMTESFTEDEIDEAKVILVEIIHRKKAEERVKNDQELNNWIKGRNNPGKKKRQIDDIVNIFSRLDGYASIPEFLMSASFVKRAPRLDDPDDNVESVSHKVKCLNL